MRFKIIIGFSAAMVHSFEFNSIMKYLRMKKALRFFQLIQLKLRKLLVIYETSVSWGIHILFSSLLKGHRSHVNTILRSARK